jgi:hypothetical protein
VDGRNNPRIKSGDGHDGLLRMRNHNYKIALSKMGAPNMLKLCLAVMTATAVFALIDISAMAAPNAGKCSSLQARCAVEIGGRCDPATGRWEYGRNGAGGNAQAHNACLSRGLAGKK